MCACGRGEQRAEDEQDDGEYQHDDAGSTRTLHEEVQHGQLPAEKDGLRRLVVDIVDRGGVIRRHWRRHAPGVPERAPQQKLDLPIQTAQVIVGPPLDRVEHLAVHANEE